jgi:hypothetical protein
MSTASSTPDTPKQQIPVQQIPVQPLPVQQLIENRLDAIDQALLGLLPRQERLAAVGQVEARIRELAAASAANLTESAQSLALSNSALSIPASGAPSLLPQPQFFAAATGGWFSGPKKKRSRLAVTAGVLGILALALMFATPVTYLFIMAVGEVLGEFVAYAILGAHVFAITIGGLAAVGLGLAALVSLKRRKEQLAGHAWAITGLCTGPLPLLVGCVTVLYVGIELGAVEYFTSGQSVAGDAVSPTASDPQDGNGPVAMSVPPSPQYPNSPSPIQSVGHVVPTSAYPTLDMANGQFIPEDARPSTSTRLEHAPGEPRHQPEPPSGPRPEAPAEPVDMPESAPSIFAPR